MWLIKLGKVAKALYCQGRSVTRGDLLLRGLIIYVVWVLCVARAALLLRGRIIYVVWVLCVARAALLLGSVLLKSFHC